MYIDQLLQSLRSRRDSLLRLIGNLNRRLDTLPDGKLRVQSGIKHTSYYFVPAELNSKGRYLNKDDISLISKLAEKQYLKKLIRTAEYEERIISRMLKEYPTRTVEKVYDGLTDERKKLVRPICLSDEEYKRLWLQKPYNHNPIDKSIPVYETMKGLRVRSKSEMIIAERLDAKGIPYKYECPLKLGSEIIHPDFTILRMSDRSEIYYEHLGKMDDPDYAAKNIRRINNYSLNGIIPGKNLFTTMESLKNPLDVRVLDQMIEEVFR